MTSFLDKFDLLSKRQYGFTAGSGTDSLLEDLADTLHTSLDNNKFACALFLDVSKAFDSIFHKISLKKLFDYGFRGPFLSLLSSFLSNRTQQVFIRNTRSTVVTLKSGVPQGSVLAPLLFNMYVNKQAKAVFGCELYQYADDTLLVSRHINCTSTGSTLTFYVCLLK